MASFVGLSPGKAHFVGLYRIGEARELDHDAFWRIPGNLILRDMGYEGFTTEEAERLGSRLQFDLERLPFYSDWRGRLVIDFPPPERSWFRWVDRGTFPVNAILEESAFAAPPPDWRDIDLTFAELATLPGSWRARLAEWRGIYLIFDESDRRTYVGAAYGRDNILGRWQAYARDGHGGNRDLRGRDPRDFRFSILERLAPDLPPEEVIARENSWKLRLHSRQPFGLNAN
ncbi:MAG: GIY-YIG nuclease family protein [Gammaproteobacteria bacterium]|nr:GIY-YIG nuclease family protein [Gammaproteobacteria bacterium]